MLFKAPLELEVLDQWKEHNLKLVNVYSQMFDENDIQELISKIDGENDLAYALFIDTNLTAVAHSNEERIGIVLDDEGSIAAAQGGQEYAGYFTWSVTETLVLDILTPIYMDNQLLGALNIGVHVDTATLNSALKGSLIKIAITFILSSVIVIVVLIMVFRYLVEKPIKNLSESIVRFSNYDLTLDEKRRDLRYVDRTDEIGIITRALEGMQKNFVTLIDIISDTSQQVSASAEELTATSEQSATAAEEMARTIEEIAKGASGQANNTEKGVIHITELGSLIEKEQEHLTELNTSANEVERLKREGTQMLELLVDNTNTNNRASKEIKEIIINTNDSAEKIEAASQMIRNIAEQTNLLALNAAIEAARAGDAGRGFAVVADEIRKLAEQSSQFTEEIGSIIKELTDKTSDAVNTIEDVGRIVDSQTESVENTNRKFEGIAQAIGRMKNAIDVMNQSGQEMDKKKQEIISIIENLSAISQENAAGTQEASASIEEQTASMAEIANASEALASLANEMQNNITRFKL